MVIRPEIAGNLSGEQSAQSMIDLQALINKVNEAPRAACGDAAQAAAGVPHDRRQYALITNGMVAKRRVIVET
jgi:hypothetical protein